MHYPPTPPEEAQRLATLRRYALLDTPPEAAFDRLTGLAARLFQVPLALVTLIDRERQWFKSCQGPASADLPLRETPRDIAFCAHTILSHDLLVVEDTCLDPRFAANPLVQGAPHVRFYAGAPLVMPDGPPLGSLCLVDFQPRTFSPHQLEALRDLAAGVVSEMELRRSAADLAQSEQLYRQMFHSSPQPMFVYDTDTLQFLAVNDTAVAQYGYSREEFLARTICAIRPPEDIDAVRRAARRPGEGTRAAGLWRHRKKDGSLLWADITTHATQFAGRPARMVVANDVTERHQAEEALRRAESRLRLVVSNLPVVVWALDADGVFTFSDGLGLELLDLKPGEAVGSSAFAMYRDDPKMVAQLQQALSGRIDFWRDNVKGVTFETHVTPLRDSEGKITGIIGVSLDITRQNALEWEREELLAQTESLLADALHSADHDPLTGLLNHRAFHKRLDEGMQGAGPALPPVALLLLDLDNFKFFNDAYGHLAGDDLLRQAAQALNCCGGAADTLARFGGDEFALLMPGATCVEADRMASDMRAAIGQIGYRPPGYDTAIPLNVSVGIACLPDDGITRQALLEAADARLRVAKTGGEDDGDALRLRQRLTHSVTGFSMLDALVTAVDNKDRYTRRHSEDVMTYSVQIARELGLDANAQHDIEIAALLHDVGKIGVPDSILRKPGKLSDEDFAAIQQHPLIGAFIVGAIPGFEATLDAVRHHHERWDGGGYPFGLAGEETPLMARLMAVADAYSAMTTDRPYRKGMEASRAMRLLEEGAGTQWDPACVAAFLRARGKLE